MKPRHILVIPDGNRRFAKKNKLCLEEAYTVAAEKISDVINWFAEEDGVKELTVYGLSYDNIQKRGEEELDPILKAWANEFIKWCGYKPISENDVNVKIKTSNFEFPAYFCSAKESVENKTKKNSKKQVNILIGYSGTRDIQKAINNVGEGENPDIMSYMQVDNAIDAMIRTGSAYRLSDCPLHQLCYAELFFLDKLFPELGQDDFKKIMEEYGKRAKRFGR
ncbi:MAG: undecaprenyl diphosphate synthase family protein [Candidatus Diapherotrites archaeon]|nr:undecaprenyl diphosphate synthase family protein [Candidatus Diapherotrites archaeon]